MIIIVTIIVVIIIAIVNCNIAIVIHSTVVIVIIVIIIINMPTTNLDMYTVLVFTGSWVCPLMGSKCMDSRNAFMSLCMHGFMGSWTLSSWFACLSRR